MSVDYGLAVPEQRPEPSASLTGAELQRWYWLKSELLDLARELGISTAGGKIELTQRISARLDGRESIAPVRPSKPNGHAAQLHGPLTRETVIPQGQRSSQLLRAFFEAEIGPGFRFAAKMRAFVSERAGATLGAAVEHWHADDGDGGGAERHIGQQFELNRFTRQWHLDHPDGTREEMRAAWQNYRSLPHDARSRA